jgi:hypothetical protein
MAVAVDASALGGKNIGPERRSRLRPMVRNKLSENIQSRALEFDSSTASALHHLIANTTPKPLYDEDNLSDEVVPLIKPKPKAKSEPAPVKKKRKQTKAQKAKQRKARKAEAEAAATQFVGPAAPEKQETPTVRAECSATIEEFLYHICQGEPRAAKQYLEYHFTERGVNSLGKPYAYLNRKALGEWLSVHSDEILEASLITEPTNYGGTSVPMVLENANRTNDEWLEHNGPETALKFSSKSPLYVAEKGELLYKGKKTAFYLRPTPINYNAWLEKNSPMPVHWLDVSDPKSYVEQTVTDYEPVMVGKVQIGMRLIHHRAKVPVSGSYVLDAVKANAKRYHSQVARYGDMFEAEVRTKPQLVIDNTKPKQKPMSTAEVISRDVEDSPPWDEPETTFYHIVQEQRQLKAERYEMYKLRVDSLRASRIRAQFNKSMGELASSTHQPSESNFSDAPSMNTLYMDGSYEAANDEQVDTVYVDSVEEANTLKELQAEFEALSLWERGEVKVAAEDAGVSVHTILDTKRQLQEGHRLCNLRRKSREDAEELERYHMWFRWKESDHPSATDQQRYTEYWYKVSLHAEVQHALGGMEERAPSCTMHTAFECQCDSCSAIAKTVHRVMSQRKAKAATERSRKAVDEVMARFNKRRWKLSTGYPTNAPRCEKPDIGKGKAGTYLQQEVPREVKPKVVSSNRSLNAPIVYSESETRSVIRTILEEGSAKMSKDIKDFEELIKAPVVNLRKVSQYINRFTQTESGLLVPG